MALSETTLKQEIQKFADFKYAGFVAAPVTIEAAKQAWASAFQTYLDDIIANSPEDLYPVDTSINVSACGAAFKTPLIFNNTGTGTSITAANEFADAWAAAMAAIVLVPGAQYLGISSGSPIISFTSFATIATNKAALLATLLLLFADIYQTNEIQIGLIAAAFHTATIDTVLTTPCVYTNPSGPPSTLTGAIGFN